MDGLLNAFRAFSGDLARVERRKVLAGLGLAAICGSLALPGSFAVLPGVLPGFFKAVAALASLGSVATVLKDVSVVRDERVRLERVDEQQVAQMRSEMTDRLPPGGAERLR